MSECVKSEIKNQLKKIVKNKINKRLALFGDDYGDSGDSHENYFILLAIGHCTSHENR